MKKENSTIDILPECLIEKILSHLSFKEATKMTILSKTWLQAWLTLPTLKFTIGHRELNSKIVDNTMERYRKGKIPIERLELSGDYSYCYEKWLDIALENGIKYLVFESCPSSLPISRILSVNTLTELVLNSCDLNPASYGVNCLSSLTKLSLIRVNLDENMLQTLLNTCPSIDTLILKYCSGLKKIELLFKNLRKIKSVSIFMTHENQLVNIQAPTLEHLSIFMTCENQLVNIQAPTLEHLSYAGHSWAKLDVIECQNLKSLDLYLQTYDGFLNKGHLRKLISKSKSLKVLSIKYNCCCRKEIKGAYDLPLYRRVSIPKVDVLNISIDKECTTFLDALLRNCRPRRLNICSSSILICTFFMNHLMYIKNLGISSCRRSKNWRQLKQVRGFDWENQRLELIGKLVITRSFIYFLLDWP